MVDDDVQLQRALVAVLSREGFEPTAAADAASGLEHLATASADVLILDLTLPDQDGVEVVRGLRGWNDIPILILSGVLDQRRRVEALDAGADDFLQKPFGIDELVARLRALTRRARVASEGEADPIRTYGGLHVDLSTRTVSVVGTEIRLTPKEWRLLETFVLHPGRLLTYSWLLAEVWDDGYGDETRAALRAHIRTLRAKIGDDAQDPTFLRTDSGSGYRWIAVENGQGAAASAVPVATAPPAVAPQPPLEGVETAALVHDLNNGLTALRIAVRLLRPRDDGVVVDVESVSTRVDEIVDRVARLAVELERRVGVQTPA
ncbi:hypothetical protein BH11ACT8_BH11ACT8_04230 [soil metagenome]